MYKTPYAKTQPKIKSPYTEIYLIRHCHPDYDKQKKLGDKNMPLSSSGKRQRRFLTDRLLKMNIDKVYTSDIQRAKETASLYLKKTKKEACIDEDLNEIHWEHWVQIKYFNMSEKTRRERFSDHKRLDKQLDKIQAKVRPVIASIYKENKGKRVAIFSHGNFIKGLLTGILNADIIGFLSMEIFQSSISKIIIDKNGYIKIVFINDVHHLPHAPKKDLFITLSKSESK